MFFNRKVIAAISSSTLFVASNGDADRAPLFIDEEKVQRIEASCPCSISDLYGSDFSCNITGSINSFSIPNFGETDSDCTHYDNEGGGWNIWPFVSADDTSATYYAYGSVNVDFMLDSTKIEEDSCEYGGSYTEVKFGCWACPTPPPTFFPTDSPSSQPSDGGNDDSGNTDDDESDTSVNPTADDENDEECCCCERLSLFSSIQKLLLI